MGVPCLSTPMVLVSADVSHMSHDNTACHMTCYQLFYCAQYKGRKQSFESPAVLKVSVGWVVSPAVLKASVGWVVSPAVLKASVGWWLVLQC